MYLRGRVSWCHDRPGQLEGRNRHTAPDLDTMQGVMATTSSRLVQIAMPRPCEDAHGLTIQYCRLLPPFSNVARNAMLSSGRQYESGRKLKVYNVSRCRIGQSA